MGISIEWILLAVILLFVVARTSAFQTWLGQRATDYYSKELGVLIKIEQIDIQDLEQIQLKNVYIEDEQGDTLVAAGFLNTQVASYSIKKKFITIERIELSDSRIKVRNLADGSGFNFDFIEDYFASDEEEDTTSEDWTVDIKNIYLNNAHISYSDETNDPAIAGFDENYINVRANIHVSDIKLEEEVMVYINYFQAIDHSGFELQNLTGQLTVLPGGFQLNDLTLETRRSLLLADEFYLKGMNDSWGDFDNFYSDVKLKGVFKDGSNLNLGDLSYFSSDLTGVNTNLKMKGKIRGTVENLKAKDFWVKFDKMSYFKGDFDFDGLPDFENTFMALNVDELRTSKKELENIELPPFDGSEYLELPDNVADLGQFELSGSFMGYINDFVAFGNLETAIGDINTDIELKYDPASDDFTYKGNLAAQNFNIGQMYDLPGVGNLTAKISIDTGFSLLVEDLYAKVSGTIDAFELNGYTYKNFKISNGSLTKNYFNGDIALRDPNIQMDYAGKVDFGGRIPKFDFDMAVRNAHITELNLFDGKEDASVCFTAKVEKTQGSSLDNFLGHVKIKDISYHEAYEDVEINSINISMTKDSTIKTFLVDSDMLTLEVEGDYKFGNLENSFMKIGSSLFPTLIDPITLANQKQNDNFSYRLDIWDVSPVSEILDIDFSIYPGTYFSGTYDSKYDIVEVEAESELLIFEDYHLNNLRISGTKSDDFMTLDIKSDTIDLGDDIQFENFDLYLEPADYSYFNVSWNNQSGADGMINGSMYIHSPEKIELDLVQADFSVAKQKWGLNQTANVLYDTDSIFINHFGLQSDNQLITANGKISENANDLLSLDVKNIDLINVNPFLDLEDMIFGGIVNGTVELSNLFEEPRYNSDMKVDTFSINDSEVGNIDFDSHWEPEDLSMVMKGGLIRNEFKSIDFSGKLFPYKENDNLDFNLDFRDTDLGIINQFLPQSDIREFHAYAQGVIHVGGEIKEPELNGKLKFEEGQLKFVYLNTRYYFDGQIDVKKNRIDITNMPLYDEDAFFAGLPQNGFLTGEILHDNFENMEFDFNLNFNNMLLMNTTYEQNPLFYGVAYATGNVNIFGYDEFVNIGVVAKTDKGTVFNLPLYGADEIVLQDFVRFVAHDTSKTTEEYKVDLENITMSFGLDITEDAEVQILFDPAIGDVMRGTAKGHLDMEVNELGKFVMFGDLEVVSGDYLFTMYNVINKRFTIEPGGTIKWQSGDPYEAIVDLTTKYATKAPLYNLVGIDEDKYKRKAEVDCFMTLKNDLYNPDLSFNIKVPKGDQNVESALSKVRNDQEELTKQFFSLMVINNFISANSGNYGNAALNATTADLLNNQLSNWLSQLSDEFDIGFNYSPGDALTQQELAVAFETQLFNDKIELKGNFGYAQSASSNNSNLIGDFNIEYKANEDGTFRLRAFNETNDFDVTNLSPSRYTQGVGMYYQEEFDNVKEIKIVQKFKNWNANRKKNKEERQNKKLGVTPTIPDDSEEEPISE